MKIYIIFNKDEIVLAVFKKKHKAKRFVKNIGKKIWNEQWVIETHKLNKIDKWLYKES